LKISAVTPIFRESTTITFEASPSLFVCMLRRHVLRCSTPKFASSCFRGASAGLEESRVSK
jgi:hypothetical protein